MSAILLSAVRDADDVPVVLDGVTWVVSPVDDVVLVSGPCGASLRREWLAPDASLADAVRLAAVESAPRAPTVAAVAAALLAGRVLVAPRVTCGRIHSATDREPRWGCYRDPGGVQVLGEHVIPVVEIDEIWGGFDISHVREPDSSVFGAALAFVEQVGLTGARAALERHPVGCGACDTETPCPDCAAAYGLLDAAEGAAALETP